jgi:hypothetical protein
VHIFPENSLTGDHAVGLDAVDHEFLDDRLELRPDCNVHAVDGAAPGVAASSNTAMIVGASVANPHFRGKGIDSNEKKRGERTLRRSIVVPVRFQSTITSY